MSFSFKKSITINHTLVPNTDQTNFPVLVSVTDPSLKTVGNGGHVQNASGFDVGFYSDSGLTIKLPWETELYTASTGQVIYWVQIPTVSHTTDTTFYMAYGDSTITTDQSNKTGTWDTGYKAVWHMDDNAASTTVLDSTSNTNNATNVANTSAKTTASGEIGSALTYNGSTDGTTAPAIASLVNASQVTMSAWVKFNALADFTVVMDKTNAAATQRVGIILSGTGVSGSNNTAIIALAGGGSSGTFGYSATGTVTTGTLYYLVSVFDGSQSTNATRIKLYVNGSPLTLTINGGLTIPATVANSADQLTLGTEGTHFLNGTLDEVRVSNTARTADWIKTEYNNQSSPSTFYTFGPEVGFSYKKAITINHNQVPNTDQLNFPVLVSITDPSLKSVGSGGHVQNSSGFDIAFYADSTLTTRLPWETELYTATSGQVIYWVQIPTVSHTTDTTFYIAYGNPNITTDQSNKNAVWDSNYKAVFHLANGTVLSGADSTSNGIVANGTTGITASAGQIDGGFTEVGGTGRGVITTTAPANAQTLPITMSVWFNASSLPANSVVLGLGNHGNSTWFGLYMVYTSGGSVGADSVNNNSFLGAGSANGLVTTGVWHYLVGVYSSSTLRTVYLDGQSVGTDTTSSIITQASTALVMGNDFTPTGANPMSGSVDEVRVSNAVRSGDWIATEYNNQKTGSTFLTLGSEIGGTASTLLLTGLG